MLRCGRMDSFWVVDFMPTNAASTSIHSVVVTAIHCNNLCSFSCSNNHDYFQEDFASILSSGGHDQWDQDFERNKRYLYFYQGNFFALCRYYRYYVLWAENPYNFDLSFFRIPWRLSLTSKTVLQDCSFYTSGWL